MPSRIRPGNEFPAIATPKHKIVCIIKERRPSSHSLAHDRSTGWLMGIPRFVED
jgi:hypothetical protein